jgi:carbon-monoxide dehydrogenase medium subunit
MKPFEFHEPSSIEAASRLLLQHGPSAAALAGGTALLIDMRHAELQPRHIVSLWNILGLDGFQANGGFHIGPLLTVTDLGDCATHPALQGLREAARSLGSWQVQNVATVGGNLCKASPGADLVPPLLCLDAQLSLRSADGERQIPLDGFLTGPDETALAPGELLARIHLPPPPPHTGTAFLKIMRRRAVDCSIVSVCARVSLESDGVTCREARIGLAAVAPNPIRAPRAETLLAGRRLDETAIGAAAREARAETRPISDVRASADYRRHLVETLVARTVRQAAMRARREMGGA